MIGTGVALDPGGAAIGVVFFFPDGDCCLDRVNDGPASSESGIPVCCGDGHADSDLADLQVTGAVDAAGRDNIMLADDFCKDAITLLLCEGGEGLVFKGGDLASLVMIAHPALKTGETACRGVPYLITKCLRVNGLVG